jgi:hypothetical protein
MEAAQVRGKTGFSRRRWELVDRSWAEAEVEGRGHSLATRCTKGTEKTVDARGKWEIEVWGETEDAGKRCESDRWEGAEGSLLAEGIT